MTRAARSAPARGPAVVVIVGTGAMACWLGGLLARHGACDVTLGGTWPDALARIRRDGIRWRSPETSFRAPVAAVPLTGALPAADAVIVLVKATQTGAVAAHAVRAQAPGAPIVSLQNGLGAREALGAAWSAAHPGAPGPITLGVATVGARVRAPGEVEVTGRGRIVLEREPAAAPGLGDLFARLCAAGIETELVDDLRPHVWRKLVANCAINALTALHGVRNGALLERADLRPAFEAAAREAAAVAHALGVDVGADAPALAAAVATATAANSSSMLQDLERGAATEVDAIHGAVVRAGHALGVPTPTLQSLWDAVRAREAGVGAARL